MSVKAVSSSCKVQTISWLLTPALPFCLCSLSQHFPNKFRMRPFHTMLLALALVVLCSDVTTKMVAANGGGGGATVTPMDCKVLPPIPGICKPKKCMQDCQGGLGKRTSVGQCVSDGCQCTYCTNPPRAVRN